MQNISCYKETQDDWCPNFSGNMVQISFFNGKPENREDIVCITGADDCEQSYTGEDAEYIFMRLLELEYVNFNSLEKLGVKSDLSYQKNKEDVPFILENKFTVYSVK